MQPASLLFQTYISALEDSEESCKGFRMASAPAPPPFKDRGGVNTGSHLGAPHQIRPPPPQLYIHYNHQSATSAQCLCSHTPPPLTLSHLYLLGNRLTSHSCSRMAVGYINERPRNKPTAKTVSCLPPPPELSKPGNLSAIPMGDDKI